MKFYRWVVDKNELRNGLWGGRFKNQIFVFRWRTDVAKLWFFVIKTECLERGKDVEGLYLLEIKVRENATIWGVKWNEDDSRTIVKLDDKRKWYNEYIVFLRDIVSVRVVAFVKHADDVDKLTR